MSVIFLLVSSILITYIESDDKCYMVNKGIFNKNITSIKPNDCVSIAIDCCYIYVNYKIGVTNFENSYCATLRTSKDKYTKQLINMYSDEIKFYANNTYSNYKRFSTIGGNLNYNYYSDYRCLAKPKPEDFSTYRASICAKFDSDGNECIITNDQSKFDSFVSNIYQELSSVDCSEDTSVCQDPFDPKTQSNDNLLPLFEELSKSLRVGNDTKIENTAHDDANDWKDECEPLPNVDVRVICDDSYVAGNHIAVLSLKYTILILFLFYII